MNAEQIQYGRSPSISNIIFEHMFCISPWTVEDGERKDMKEVFQEYGGVIVTIVAVAALIIVIAAVIGPAAEGGIVFDAFDGLINNFVDKASKIPGGE